MADWIALFAQGPEAERIVALEVQAFLLRLHHFGGPLTKNHGSISAGITHKIRRECRHCCPAAGLASPGLGLRSLSRRGSARDVAAAIGVSAPYLTQLFRQHVGQSLLATIVDLRLIEAQRLLLCTDQPVTHIALACGFGSLNRFFCHLPTAPRLQSAAYRMRFQRTSGET